MAIKDWRCWSGSRSWCIFLLWTWSEVAHSQTLANLLTHVNCTYGGIPTFKAPNCATDMFNVTRWFSWWWCQLWFVQLKTACWGCSATVLLVLRASVVRTATEAVISSERIACRVTARATRIRRVRTQSAILTVSCCNYSVFFRWGFKNLLLELLIARCRYFYQCLISFRLWSTKIVHVILSWTVVCSMYKLFGVEAVTLEYGVLF